MKILKKRACRQKLLKMKEEPAEREDTKQYYKYSELERTLEKIKEKTDP